MRAISLGKSSPTTCQQRSSGNAAATSNADTQIASSENERERERNREREKDVQEH